MSEGSELASIDGNTDAAEEFLAGNGAHYEVKLDRNDVKPSYTRGAMSKTLWDGAMAQGFMNVIELNSSNGWALVTYPNSYTSYLSKYTILSKDRIKAEWTGQFYPGFTTDKDLNEQTIRQNILNNYYAENLFIPVMPGSHVFFVINTETKEWFKGLVSHMCVLSNAVMAKAAAPEAEIIIDAACTDSFDQELHNKALDLMEALQMTVVNR